MGGGGGGGVTPSRQKAVIGVFEHSPNTLSNHPTTCGVGHTAWVPEGREGRSQAGPKGRKLEVGAQRAPKLLV